MKNQKEPDQKKIAALVKKLLLELGEDPSREGLKKTPERVAKSLVFLTRGYRQNLKSVVNGAYFTSDTNHMVILKDIELYSMCEHHMLPFYGKCAIGYISRGKVLGVSKLARIVDMFSRRLQIQERMTEEISLSDPPAGKGEISKADVSAAYAAFVASTARLGRKMHLAMDFANGMGIAEAAAFAGTGISYDALYGEYDGDFPNHDANPLHVETLADLQAMVKAGKYDFGVAFDGDADRAGFIDERGEIVPMDFVTALIAKDLLSREPGAACFCDLRSSRVCGETIAAAGGRPMMSRVGHSFIKAQMRENDAIFAGELSGHYYFKANYTAESSSMATIALANIVGNSGKTLSELVAPLRKYFQSGEINTKTSRPPAEVLSAVKAAYEGKARVFELDGVSVDAWDAEGWWANVRMSNTEPLVRLNLEGRDEKTMQSKRDEFLSLIRS